MPSPGESAMQKVFNNCERRMATGIVWALLLAGGAAAQGWRHVGDVQRACYAPYKSISLSTN
jgi:hypothetical protein